MLDFSMQECPLEVKEDRLVLGFEGDSVRGAWEVAGSGLSGGVNRLCDLDP